MNYTVTNARFERCSLMFDIVRHVDGQLIATQRSTSNDEPIDADESCTAKGSDCSDSSLSDADTAEKPNIFLTNSDGSISIDPILLISKSGTVTAKFDLASGMKGKCIPGGKWRIDGDCNADVAEICTDFSKGSCKYTVKVVNEGNSSFVLIDYTPTVLGIKDKITTFGLRLPFSIGKLFKGSSKRVLFTSESRSSVSGNMQYVLDAADGDYNGNKVMFSFFSGKSRLLFYIKTSFIMGLCSTVVIDDYYPLIYRINFGKDVRVIQLWHACGAFKAVGYSRLGKSGAPQPDDITHRNYTHVTVSSEDMRQYYAEAFGIPLGRIYATGIPRTDIFFDKAYENTVNARFFAEHPQFKGKRIILFAPTFRGDGAHSAHYPSEMIDFKKLASYCRVSNSAIVFKMHPFVKGFRVPEGYDDVFADESGEREVNDLLFSANILITDYSSVIYEFSLLDRPVIFYAFDLEEYCEKRDFYEPFGNYTAGKLVRSCDELIGALQSNDFEQFKLRAFREHSMSACDGNSSKRVAELVFGVENSSDNS